MQIALLHLALSIASSSVFPITFKSSRTQSSHLCFGHPLVLLPVSHFLILLPTYSSFLLTTCPSHLSLVSLSLSRNFPTNIFLRMSSFFTLSSFVFPNEYLSIFISATSIFSSCLFVTATVSIAYVIAGRTIVLYSLPYTFAGALSSHITPVIFLHSLQPACTLFTTSFSTPPSFWTNTSTISLPLLVIVPTLRVATTITFRIFSLSSLLFLLWTSFFSRFHSWCGSRCLLLSALRRSCCASPAGDAQTLFTPTLICIFLWGLAWFFQPDALPAANLF